jgi:outer membrane PBP1 activator LpoA protein
MKINKKEVGMKKNLVWILMVWVAVGFMLAGCTKKAASSDQAIANTQSMKTVQEKAYYLVAQANTFYKSKEFQQAIDAAQYVLSNLDKNSQQAKSLIEKAKAELTKLGQQKLDQLKGKISGFGK